MNPLFTPVRLGRIDLTNRLVMAPMTRSRADDAGVVGDLTATYYAQRAGAGMIVTEGVFPTASGKGYVRTPGVETDAQVAGWRRVADAVHDAGGRIVMQIMHTGRISHPDLQAGVCCQSRRPRSARMGRRGQAAARRTLSRRAR